MIAGDYYSGKLVNRTYNAVHMEFHSSSDHTIKLDRKEVEIQIYMKSKDPYQDYTYGVLAILFDVYKDSKYELPKFWNKVITGLKDKTKTTTNPVINMWTDFGDDMNAKMLWDDLYSYKGSSTIPPCNENVFWFVCRETMSITQDQLDILRGWNPE